MRYFPIALLCLVFCLTACAQRMNEHAAEELRVTVKDLDQRLAALEQRLFVMTGEVSVLKSQPYAVKTTRGAKTDYVASAPVMPAPPPLAAEKPPVPPVPPMQQQGGAWFPPPDASPPSSSSRGTGARAVPAPSVQGPRTLIPQDAAQAGPVAQPGHPAGLDELALPPETPVGALQAANIPAPRGGKQASPPSSPQGQSSEESIYNKALAEFNASRYAQAATGFTDLIYAYPSGRYAPNAVYWLGESLYGQNLHNDALAQFKEVTSRFPQHHKAPDAMFKAGLCYLRLGDRDSAALQFRALAANYPNSPAANLARQRGFVR